jgi:WD40 repeat protein
VVRQVTTLTGHSEHVNTVAFFPDGKRVVSGSNDRLVQIWNAETGADVSSIGGDFEGCKEMNAFCLRFALALCYTGPEIMLVWQACMLTGHSQYSKSVAFSPDGKRVVTKSGDTLVKIRNAATGAEVPFRSLRF